MAFYLTSCADYLTVIARVDTIPEAVETCRRLEAERNDGFAVCAWDGGRMVADAEGPVDAPGMSAYERQERSGDAY